MKRICYDVIGEKNDKIQILENDEFTVHGLLKDDFYMHKIFVYHKEKTIVADTGRVLVSPKEPWVWRGQGTEDFYFPNDIIRVSLKENLVNISSISTQTNRMTSVIITKMTSYISGSNLNVHFYSNYKNSTKGGIIGEIEKKVYRFFDLIQSDEKKNSEGKSYQVAINGNLFKCHNIIREGEKCCFFKFNDLIFPQTSSKFVAQNF